MTHSDGRDTFRDVIREVFSGYLREPILRTLNSGPSRFSEIRTELIGKHGEAPGDSHISSELRRLRKLGLVQQETVQGSRHPAWSLTDEGRRVVKVLDAAYGAEGLDAAPPEGQTGWASLSTRERRVAVGGIPELGIDTSKPHPARRYDYWLGGKDNFLADRESGDEIARVYPAARLGARENRAFLRRAVAFLTAEAGIRQFLDIGTGLPTANNTHEVAQSIAPESRVVYADNDPLVLTHARALLIGDPRGSTAYIEADLRDPESILDHPALAETLDLTQPVGLILVAVLHFIPGKGAAKPIVEKVLSRLPAGSFVVASHGTQDYLDPETAERYWTMYHKGQADVWPRDVNEFSSLFDGLQLIEPGIVQVDRWRPAANPTAHRPEDINVWAAVARKS